MPSPLTAVYQVGIEIPDASPLVVGHASPVSTVSLLSVDGLGPSVNSQTIDLSFRSGVAVGFDTNASRMLKLTFEIFTPGEDDDAMNLWTDLNDAFEAVEDGGTLRNLWIWLPGTKFGHREFEGRPRGMTDDGLVSLPHGVIHVDCTFEVTTGTLGTQIVEEP